MTALAWVILAALALCVGLFIWVRITPPGPPRTPFDWWDEGP